MGATRREFSRPISVFHLIMMTILQVPNWQVYGLTWS
jgi:hypothetical protein